MKLNHILFAAVGLATASLAGTASADPSLYLLGKCVDVPGASTTNGTGVQIYDCNGGANQQWEFLGDGTVRPNYDTNKCLDLPGWETADQTPIQIYDCNGGSNQQWALESDGTLRGYGGKCVDDPSGSTSDGTFFQYYDCNGGSNQQFTLAPVVTGDILTRWQSLGGPGGFLGLPTSNPGAYGDGTIQYFTNGYIALFNGAVVAYLGNEIIVEIPISAVASQNGVALTQPIVLSIFSNGGVTMTGNYYDSTSSWEFWDDAPGSTSIALALGWEGADGTLFTFKAGGKMSATTQSARTVNINSSTSNTSIAGDWNNFVNGGSLTWQSSASYSLSGVLSDVEAAAGPVGKIISVL